MGYRSDVAIECDKETYDKVLEVCKSENFMPDKRGHVSYGYNVKTDPWILVWEEVKWIGYQDAFDHIVAIQKALEEGDCYHFLAVGEDGYVEEYSTEKFENQFIQSVWVEHTIGSPSLLEH